MKLRYFAWVRERIGHDEEEIDLPDNVADVAGLMSWLAGRDEGYAAALEKIFSIAQTVDQKTMTLQYFETLKDMGASPSTKYIFPLEFSKFIERFTKGEEG